MTYMKIKQFDVAKFDISFIINYNSKINNLKSFS